MKSGNDIVSLLYIFFYFYYEKSFSISFPFSIQIHPCDGIHLPPTSPNTHSNTFIWKTNSFKFLQVTILKFTLKFPFRYFPIKPHQPASTHFHMNEFMGNWTGWWKTQKEKRKSWCSVYFCWNCFANGIVNIRVTIWTFHMWKKYKMKIRWKNRHRILFCRIWKNHIKFLSFTPPPFIG